MNADKRRFFAGWRTAAASKPGSRRWVVMAIAWALLLCFPDFQHAQAGTLPPAPPVLVHGEMECATGFVPPADAPDSTERVPSGWSRVVLTGTPTLSSARLFFTGSCDNDAPVERLEGEDAIVVRAQDIETPPAPGKPFDVVYYQRVAVQPGGDYSLSAWMLSLCGGSAVPSDCPPDVYINKMLGIDPTGGVDPLAASVGWVENGRNFVENEQRVGWQNLRLAATAQGSAITLFVRISSPFQWHGNHAFIDAVSLVRAPQATLATLPARVEGRRTLLRWSGLQSPDAAAIPGGTYALGYDVQYRIGDGPWRTWRVNDPGNSAVFTAFVAEQPHDFRVRARSEQPPEPPEPVNGEVRGAWPNHRYPGVWSAPQRVIFSEAAEVENVYLPLVAGGQ